MTAVVYLLIMIANSFLAGKKGFFTNDHFTISDYVDDLGVLNPAIEELNLSLSSNDRIVKVNKKVSTYISNNIIK